jgi:hypothetical protein
MGGRLAGPLFEQGARDMIKRAVTILILMALAATVALTQGRGPRGGTAQPLDISGKWTGTWSSYNPNQATKQPDFNCAKLDANVIQKGDVWEAAFEGDCGRPYKYSIKMEGRRSGGAVLFKGTADLGQNDGGVYDWIGRANNTEFIGFYTNAFTTGVFNLQRVPAQPAAAPK